MRVLAALTLALAGACFSKPPYVGANPDASDAAVDAPEVTTPSVTRLAAGGRHACAIDGAGKLWCWGDNRDGQLALTGPAASGTPVQVTPTSSETWTEVAAGAFHTCGLRGTQILCWGNNDLGQAGGDNATNVVALPGGATPRSIHAGNDGSCAIDTMGRAYCWGRVEPSAGLGFTMPTQIMPAGIAQGWAQITLSPTHGCARQESGATSCWGENLARQLGMDTGGLSVAIGAAVTLGGTSGTIARVTAASNVTCAITAGDEHDLQCVGINASGLLAEAYGPSEVVGTATPVTIVGTTPWFQVALGLDHACAITQGGVQCWGYATSGALGNGFTPHLAPAPVAWTASAPPTEVVTGGDFSCARTAAGHVACWGGNANGELGNGEIASALDPVTALTAIGTDTIEEIALGDSHTCATIATPASTTTIYCWGDNRARQVDPTVGAPDFITTPRLVGSNLRGASTAERHTCAVASDGASIRCWGDNTDDKLGGPGGNGENTIGAPAGGATWIGVAAGGDSTCAVASDGDLHCWGTRSWAPAAVNPVNDGASDWKELALGSEFGAGLFVSGGTPELGGLGSGCRFGESGSGTGAMPVQFGSGLLTGATSATLDLAATRSTPDGGHTCMRRAGSPATAPADLYCWGNNSNLQIVASPASDCVTTQNPVPPATVTWVPFVDGEVAMAIAGQHTCAIADEDATAASKPRLYCWGVNSGDALGRLPDSGVPQRVNDLPVVEVGTGAEHTCVISTNRKTVSCWGKNQFGQIGNGKRFHDRPVTAIP